MAGGFNCAAACTLAGGHITLLIDRLDDPQARDWYAAAATQYGWTRNVLTNQIVNHTNERVGSGPINFTRQLPAGDSELAQQIARDPYVFDFLGLTGEVAERDMEQALMDRIVETLRELGAGCAFVGRQVHFDVGGDDFYLDLLFFHVVQLRMATHNPTVGILICGGRNDPTVRYSLGQSDSPLAVSIYTYDTLPPEERTALPDVEQLAAALDWIDESTEPK